VFYTDFQRRFIKAETIGFDDPVTAGSVANAKSAGKAPIEGKDNIMKYSDVVELKFNGWKYSSDQGLCVQFMRRLNQVFRSSD